MKKIVAILLALSMVFPLCACSSGDYKQAKALFEEGKYEDANVLFEKLGDYQDSANYLKSCEERIKNQQDEINYDEAISLFNSGKYNEAKTLFISLGNYEKSAEYVKAINVILDPESSIEVAVEDRVDSDKEFWNAYNDFIKTARDAGMNLSSGPMVYETKYDESSKEFACLVDIPLLQDGKEYLHDYYGFVGHIDAPNVIIDHIYSYELDNSGSEKFWAKAWRH